MQIQSKHVAKPEDVERLEQLAKKTSLNDKMHWAAIAVLAAVEAFNTYNQYVG